MITPRILVHCGADAKTFVSEKKEVCNAAVTAGLDALRKTDDAVSAVEAAIRKLESSKYMDAGVGSHLQLDGKIRMDAGIMTSDFRAGGVLQIEGVRHPIVVARKLLDLGFHLYLSGEHATQFARRMGVPEYESPSKENVELYKQFRKRIKDPYDYNEIAQTLADDLVHRKDTVGAMVIDSKGIIVAGSSTGGLRSGFPGRIGDSALIGSGIYAHSRAAVVATGTGEAIIRLTASQDVYDAIAAGIEPQKACEQMVEKLTQLKAVGGILAMTKTGKIGMAYNSEMLLYGMGEL